MPHLLSFKGPANDAYWRVSEAGALELRYQVEPSTGIKDIFENGSKYAFECATAIVIVFLYGSLANGRRREVQSKT